MKRLCLIPAVAFLVMLSACSSTNSGSGAFQDGDSDASASPLYPFTLQQQGSVLLQQGRYEEALKRLEEAARLQPGNATTHNVIGLCNLKMQRYDAALMAFNRALAIIPTFTDARNNRGATYLSIGQFHLAEVDFIAVLSDTTYAHRWGVYYNLGMTYLQRGELGAAEENLRRAATAQTPVFDAYLRLAEIADEQGRTDEAISFLEEAQFRFPNRAETSMALARLLIDMGESDRARMLLEEVIANSPRSDLADQARALLASS